MNNLDFDHSIYNNLDNDDLLTKVMSGQSQAEVSLSVSIHMQEVASRPEVDIGDCGPHI